ncbi:MAG: hypothetical protein J5865_02470, partial [Lachnospiraceae bacterium]|nr:hypothetical protein [Lachnospiraceae bacterium]
RAGPSLFGRKKTGFELQSSLNPVFENSLCEFSTLYHSIAERVIRMIFRAAEAPKARSPLLL